MYILESGIDPQITQITRITRNRWTIWNCSVIICENRRNLWIGLRDYDNFKYFKL